MPDETQIEIGGERIDVVLDEDGVRASISELSDFGDAIKECCDNIRQDDRIRNDGVAHIPADNIDDILEEVAASDVTLEAYDHGAAHFISWSEP